jgi:subtilisin family serine protease
VAASFRRPLPLLVAIVIGLAAAIPVAAADPIRARDADAPDGRLIVLWRDGAPSRIGISGVDDMRRSRSRQRSVVVAERGEAGEVAAALRKDPRVLAVVPDAVIKALDWPDDEPPDDPLYPDQGNLTQIGVPDVWPTTTGDPGLTIAVIDSGVDLDHPDLTGVTVTSPRNEVWNNADVSDVAGHGTYVAGTIFARTDNAEGIAGIAPTSTLMPIKVLDDDGFGTFSDLLDGVDWAREHGADIINMSLGGELDPAQVALVQPTFTEARVAGILMTAASGNSGGPFIEYPAGLNGVISVAAVDADDVVAEFSTFNRTVDIAAPGVGIVSSTFGSYEPADGTSASAPQVAGGAALIWSARPGLEVAELEAVLRASAVDLGDPGRDHFYGSGRLDLAAALTEDVPDPLPDLEPPPGPTDPLVVEFTSPAGPVTQTATTFTVEWTSSEALYDGLLLRIVWNLVNKTCPDEEEEADDFILLELTSPVEDTGLRVGTCSRYALIAVDGEGRVAEAISAPVTVVDTTRPRITSRTPGPGKTNVARSTSIKIVFSERVKGVSGKTLRLKNLTTGLYVRAKVSYSSSKRTATINPTLNMFGGTRYRVYVRSGITDLSGNKLATTHWTFRTRR